MRNCAGLAIDFKVQLRDKLALIDEFGGDEHDLAGVGDLISMHAVLAPLSFNVDVQDDSHIVLKDTTIDPLSRRYAHACVAIPFRRSETAADADVVLMDTNAFSKPVIVENGRPWEKGLTHQEGKPSEKLNVAQCVDNYVIQARIPAHPQKKKKELSAYVYDLLSPRAVPSLSSTLRLYGGVAVNDAMLDGSVTAVEILYAFYKYAFHR